MKQHKNILTDDQVAKIEAAKFGLSLKIALRCLRYKKVIEGKNLFMTIDGIVDAITARSSIYLNFFMFSFGKKSLFCLQGKLMTSHCVGHFSVSFHPATFSLGGLSLSSEGPQPCLVCCFLYEQINPAKSMTLHGRSLLFLLANQFVSISNS